MAGAGKVRRIDKGLGEQEAMAMDRLPIRRETRELPAQNP